MSSRSRMAKKDRSTGIHVLRKQLWIEDGIVRQLLARKERKNVVCSSGISRRRHSPRKPGRMPKAYIRVVRVRLLKKRFFQQTVLLEIPLWGPINIWTCFLWSGRLRFRVLVLGCRFSNVQFWIRWRLRLPYMSWWLPENRVRRSKFPCRLLRLFARTILFQLWIFFSSTLNSFVKVPDITLSAIDNSPWSDNIGRLHGQRENCRNACHLLPSANSTHSLWGNRNTSATCLPESGTRQGNRCRCAFRPTGHPEGIRLRWTRPVSFSNVSGKSTSGNNRFPLCFCPDIRIAVYCRIRILLPVRLKYVAHTIPCLACWTGRYTSLSWRDQGPALWLYMEKPWLWEESIGEGLQVCS